MANMITKNKKKISRKIGQIFLKIKLNIIDIV